MKKWDTNYTVTKENVEHKQRHKKNKTHHTELSREPTPTTNKKTSAGKPAIAVSLAQKNTAGWNPVLDHPPVGHDKVATAQWLEPSIFSMYWYRPAWKQQTYQRSRVNI